MFFLKIVRVLIFSNVFIACCAVGLQLFCWSATTVYESVLLFCAVLTAYSVLKLAGNKKHIQQSDDTAIGWLQRNAKMQYSIAITAFLCALLCWYKLQFLFPLNWGIAVVLLLFYGGFRKVHVLSILPRIFQGFMKIGVVALVWTLTLLPFEATMLHLYLSFYLFFFILALMIPFEIRDMPHDAPFHVPTVPIILGAYKAKRLSYVLLVCACLVYWMVDASTIEHCAVGLTTIVGILMIRYSSISSSALFFMVGIDGLLLLPLALTVFLRELIHYYHTFF
jgi:1,4-dihydroxy-2-naphthoate octaprenyltransferase